MKWIFAICGFIAFALTFQACKEDPPEGFKTVAYNLNIPTNFSEAIIPADNPLTVEGVDLGRHLFYETKLSVNGSISCGSCHLQEFAFSDGGKALSQGFAGMDGKRNSMPLFNFFYHQNGFFWDGRAPLLRDQTLKPIEDPLEMGENLQAVIAKLNADNTYRDKFKAAFNIDEIDEFHLSLALEQFLHSLVSLNSKFDRLVISKGLPPQQALTPEEFRGFELLRKEFIPPGIGQPPGGEGDCFHCHNSPLFRIDNFSNNGLDVIQVDHGFGAVSGNPDDIGKFKVPSLRNILLTAPYMHDGRFANIDDVLEHYSTGLVKSSTIDANMTALDFGGLQLTMQDRSDLKAFMATLTDSSFLSNPAHSDPFK